MKTRRNDKCPCGSGDKYKEWLCRILTLGRHWWDYYPGENAYVRCAICGKFPDSMWDILCKMKAPYVLKKRVAKDAKAAPEEQKTLLARLKAMFEIGGK